METLFQSVVCNGDKRPIAGLSVSAFRKTVSKTYQLKSGLVPTASVTGDQGKFSLAYTSADQDRAISVRVVEAAVFRINEGAHGVTREHMGVWIDYGESLSDTRGGWKITTSISE